MLGGGVNDCEVEAEMGEYCLSPCVHVDLWSGQFWCREGREDDRLLRTEPGIHTSTVDQLAANVVEGQIGSAEQALLDMMSMNVK